MGTGTTAAQRESVELWESGLEVAFEKVNELYDKWRDKNRFKSALGDYNIFDPLFDPLSLDGKLVLRAFFIMLRGDRGGWIFSVIRKLIEQENMPSIEILPDEQGRHSVIRKKFLDWADEHFPPTALELFLSAQIMQEEANQSWRSVIAPDLEGNYGGTYFIGTLNNARNLGVQVKKLHDRAAVLLLKEEWPE